MRVLTRWIQVIVDELARGTGASIAARELTPSTSRRGLRIWFNDLAELSGPIAELRPYGLKSHEVRLHFGSFSGHILKQISEAGDDELQLARALFRSVANVAQLTLNAGDLTSWHACTQGFEAKVVYRHADLYPNSEAAITETCREVIVPLMAAMAELIGYDSATEELEPIRFATEGGTATVTVQKRERNPRNRLLCIRLHGKSCSVCGIDPTSIYGMGIDVIEVHHLEPLSLLMEPREYNPETDLIPLCPNCHRAVHTRRPQPIDVAVLRQKVLQSHG